MKEKIKQAIRKNCTKVIIAFVLIVISADSQGQKNKFDRSKELGLIGGTAYYLGEVNPYTHFGTDLKFGGGLSFRNNFSRRWTLKASMLYGHVEAYDKNSKDPWIRNRNLHFRNQFLEGSLQVELNFKDFMIGYEDRFSPYLFAGVSYFSMNPQAQSNGVWRPLQAAGTEGQGTSEGGAPYRTTGFALPVGVGIKTHLWAIFGFSLEWGIRRTFTDYFDDISGVYVNPNLLEDEKSPVSARLSDQSLVPELADGTNTGLQRGDPGRKDLFVFVLASLNIRFDKRATSCWDGEVQMP